MVAVVSPARGFFLAVPWVSRTKKRCGRRCPPLSACIWRGGSQSSPWLRAPPAGRASAPAGDKSPSQHQPHLIFGGQACPPLARPPPCLKGGRCGGRLAVKGRP